MQPRVDSITQRAAISPHETGVRQTCEAQVVSSECTHGTLSNHLLHSDRSLANVKLVMVHDCAISWVVHALLEAYF